MNCLDFLLRSKTYLKERPLSPSIVNRDFPLSSKPESVVSLVYTHCKVQIVLLLSGLRIVNRDFPLSSKPESVVRLVYTHYKVKIVLLLSGLRYSTCTIFSR